MRWMLLLLIFLIPVVNAGIPNDYAQCYVNVTCGNPEFSSAGKVLIEGHFANTSYSGGYNLCCPSIWNLGTGNASFRYSDLGGSQGHVQTMSYATFPLQASIGANLDSCEAKTSCNATEYEACIFRMSNDDNAHVADCVNASVPQPNSYGLRLCCTVSEICNDNIDNQGDGLTDCQSSFCHPSDNNSFLPQECTGNQQTTAYCLTYPGNCTSGGLPYYCSYGVTDNPSDQPQGFCCPAGEYATQNSFGQWECEESTECGVAPDLDCKQVFSPALPQIFNYVSEYYQGDTSDWCVSKVPYLYDPNLIDVHTASAACCPIERHGTTGYFVESGNVIVYG